MTRVVLGGWETVPKQNISEESTERHGNHNPAIVSHKDEPGRVSISHQVVWENLHEHEGVEVLQRVESRLENVCPLANLRLGLLWPEESGRLSNGFIGTSTGAILAFARHQQTLPQKHAGEVFGRRRRIELTRRSLDTGGEERLVASRNGAKAFVADAEEENGEEGED